MRFALVNGEKKEATPGQHGYCLECGAEVIAKCGKQRIFHWAHKNKEECHYSLKEPKTEWHRNWQNYFPIDCQEVRHVDEQKSEVHIADILVPQNLFPNTDESLHFNYEKLVIEFQHSRIEDAERKSREQFYLSMVWVVDGTRTKNAISKGIKLMQTLYKINYYSYYGLHEKLYGCETFHGKDNKAIKLFTCENLDRFFPVEWLDSEVPVFFDFGIYEIKGNQKILVGIISDRGKKNVVLLSADTFIKEIQNKSFWLALSNSLPSLPNKTEPQNYVPQNLVHYRGYYQEALPSRRYHHTNGWHSPRL